jgi:hypothetical protein
MCIVMVSGHVPYACDCPPSVTFWGRIVPITTWCGAGPRAASCAVALRVRYGDSALGSPRKRCAVEYSSNARFDSRRAGVPRSWS